MLNRYRFIIQTLSILALILIPSIQLQAQNNPYLKMLNILLESGKTCSYVFEVTNSFQEQPLSFNPTDIKLANKLVQSMLQKQHELFCAFINAESCINHQIRNPLLPTTFSEEWIKQLSEQHEFLARIKEIYPDHPLNVEMKEIEAQILLLETKILATKPEYFSEEDRNRIETISSILILNTKNSIQKLLARIQELERVLKGQ